MSRIVSQFLILCAVVLALSVLIRKVFLDIYDPYRCHALREGGRWLDTTPNHDGSIQPHHWQPPGCILHEYNAYEMEECLKCGRLLFAGDSDVRQLYWAMAMKANKTRAEHAMLYAEKHGDLSFEFGCSKLHFLWDPYLNSSALRSEIVTSGGVHHGGLSRLQNQSQTTIVAGGGLWHARYLGEDYLTAFQNDVGTLFNLSQNGDTIHPTSLLGSQENSFLVLPVLSPNYDMLAEDRNVTLTNDRLSTLNEYLVQISARRHIEMLWSFSSMLQSPMLLYEENGIHLLMDVVKKQADVILNLRCNAMTSLLHYPFDKTCCIDTIPYNMVQVVMLIVALLVILVWVVTTVSRVLGRQSPKLRRPEQVTALAILVLACIYCYLADRTHLFEKMQKTTDQETFLWMFGFIMALGVLTTTRSTTANHAFQTRSGVYVYCSFLSREQSEEWKGWMQFVILLYHYFGMSKVLWMYQLIRLMVASYLFMTGFGHSLFVLSASKISQHRVAAVLIRLNLLSIVLAYAMRTDYDFYYFPGLSSFWFVIIALTTRFWSWRITRPLQIFISMNLVRFAIQHPGFLEKVGEILDSTCRMRVHVHELRFRIGLDLNVVYFGMFFAMGYVEFINAQLEFPLLFTERRTRIAQSIAVAVASITLMWYAILMSRFADKYAYNRWHPELSSFPILAFVVLRNATPQLRTYHSWLFAWLGRCSLETFILQYHIWLAADTKGLLRLGLCRGHALDGPCARWCDWFEFWVITVFFLWTSWEVSKATNVLTEWIVGSAKVEPALGETEDKVDKFTASMFRKAKSKLGLKFRLAIMLAILFVANWMWR